MSLSESRAVPWSCFYYAFEVLGFLFPSLPLEFRLVKEH
ncbi:hypothetical protein TIFTF001_026040 [Ficus carica]|uniref:Uncharacterized protein n=1 Tax=Ficus carica TaxID=3494 RepID=A0AA88AK45_FICCA|nr:hypothetical protein TIFTF001_026040 [Ficus carica]